MNLVWRFRDHFGDRFPISFAAGIDRGNFADAVALGLTPITVCSDLLLPQGYGRLEGYHKELLKRMEAVGAADVDEYVVKAHGFGGDVSGARLHNTLQYVNAVNSNPRYGLEKNSKLPKKIGRTLQLFDCISCDKCVPVCPNDANFVFEPLEEKVRRVELRWGAEGSWVLEDLGELALAEGHQLANFADFCNECGNCDVFCPEDGGPYVLKPRFFGSEEAWREDGRAGFYVEGTPEAGRALGRLDDAEWTLAVAGGRHTVSGPGVTVSYDPADPGSVERQAGDGPVDLTPAFILDCVRRGVLRTDRVNYVNMLAKEPAV